LVIPLITGPGTITAMILLAGKTGGQADLAVGLFFVTALVMLTILLAFLGAQRISRVLGVTGRPVSTRMLGIILAALAVLHHRRRHGADLSTVIRARPTPPVP
jgi:multiple antibiotic resistance protein